MTICSSILVQSWTSCSVSAVAAPPCSAQLAGSAQAQLRLREADHQIFLHAQHQVAHRNSPQLLPPLNRLCTHIADNILTSSSATTTLDVRAMTMPLAASLGANVLLVTKLILHVVCAAVICAGVVCISRFCYNVTFHPLAGVPGPRLAALSNVWLAVQAKHGRLAHLGRTLHQQYGSAVRVGPNEIWFDSKEAYRAIYSESRY